MKHLFVPYEIALQLKEKGFNEGCLAFYKDKSLEFVCQDNDEEIFCFNKTIDKRFPWTPISHITTAPLFQQIIDWFREKYNIDIHHVIVAGMHYGYCLFKNRKRINKEQGFFISPKEALHQAIEEALKLI